MTSADPAVRAAICSACSLYRCVLRFFQEHYSYHELVKALGHEDRQPVLLKVGGVFEQQAIMFAFPGSCSPVLWFPDCQIDVEGYEWVRCAPFRFLPKPPHL